MRGKTLVLLALVTVGWLCCSCVAGPESLFPSAAKVRVFAGPAAWAINIDRQGHATANGPSPDDDRAVTVPARDGGWLTPAEIVTLKASVRFTRPPDAMGACCIPRHAFLFYDNAGRYLGHLRVCFECGCAAMEPFRPPSKDRTWIDWNYEALKRIVVAHGLPPVDHP